MVLQVYLKFGETWSARGRNWSMPGSDEFGGENAKVYFVNCGESGLAMAENIYWRVIGDKVEK